MPTALSSTETPVRWRSCLRRRRDDALRAVADVGPLIAFRVAAVRGRGRAVAASALSTGTRLGPALAVCGAVVGGALAFFVGHHFLHFPW